MTDTDTQQIATTKAEVFTHCNGFISVVQPKKDDTYIGIILTNGRVIEVNLDEVKTVLNRKDYR